VTSRQVAVAVSFGGFELAVSDRVWLAVGGIGIAAAGVVGLAIAAVSWWRQRPGGESGPDADDDIDRADSR
jgi:hypothetical protein